MARLLIIVGIVFLIGVFFDFWWPMIVVAFILCVVIAWAIVSKRRQEIEKEEKTRRNIEACKKYGISSLDDMSGREFEVFVGELLRRNGYQNVEVTKTSGDYGVDVIGYMNGAKYAVQCKHYSGKVGVSSVQEVYSGAKMYSASVSVVATNSVFTPAAIKMASEIGVQLWDKEKLIKMMD